MLRMSAATDKTVWFAQSRLEAEILILWFSLQGDYSGCSLGFVDLKLKTVLNKIRVRTLNRRVICINISSNFASAALHYN